MKPTDLKESFFHFFCINEIEFFNKHGFVLGPFFLLVNYKTSYKNKKNISLFVYSKSLFDPHYSHLIIHFSVSQIFLIL